VAYRIIGIALEGDARMVPTHTHVERVMEKEIRQEGTDDPPCGVPLSLSMRLPSAI
jgi:hypothetical protein